MESRSIVYEDSFKGQLKAVESFGNYIGNGGINVIFIFLSSIWQNVGHPISVSIARSLLLK